MIMSGEDKLMAIYLVFTWKIEAFSREDFINKSESY